MQQIASSRSGRDARAAGRVIPGMRRFVALAMAPGNVAPPHSGSGEAGIKAPGSSDVTHLPLYFTEPL